MKAITDSGPWRADGDCVYSGDFTHDARLTITGDFAGDEQKHAYAKMLAEKLNAAASEPGRGRGDETK